MIEFLGRKLAAAALIGFSLDRLLDFNGTLFPVDNAFIRGNGHLRSVFSDDQCFRIRKVHDLRIRIDLNLIRRQSPDQFAILFFFEFRPIELDELIRTYHRILRRVGIHEDVEHDSKADDCDDGNQGNLILFQLFGYHRYAPPVSVVMQ